MVRAMCGVQLIDRKRSTDFRFMLCMNEAMDQLAMANIVCWYGHVFWRKDGYFLALVSLPLCMFCYFVYNAMLEWAILKWVLRYFFVYWWLKCDKGRRSWWIDR